MKATSHDDRHTRSFPNPTYLAGLKSRASGAARDRRDLRGFGYLRLSSKAKSHMTNTGALTAQASLTVQVAAPEIAAA